MNLLLCDFVNLSVTPVRLVYKTGLRRERSANNCLSHITACW